MAKGKEFWASRDKAFETINIWTNKPTRDCGGYFSKGIGWFLTQLNVVQAKLLGITLKKGECRKYRLVEVKEKGEKG